MTYIFPIELVVRILVHHALGPVLKSLNHISVPPWSQVAILVKFTTCHEGQQTLKCLKKKIKVLIDHFAQYVVLIKVLKVGRGRCMQVNMCVYVSI